MKKIITIMIAAIYSLCSYAQPSTNKNVAYQDATVRFTLISPSVIRLEYHPQGSFVDAHSFVAINREYAEVKHSITQNAKQVTIKTENLTLTYKKGEGGFTADNLSIRHNKQKNVKWYPGLKDTLNLKGTYRTLDGYDGNMRGDQPMPIEDGLLSRSGWTLIDDSDNFLFDQSEWPWVEERLHTEGAQDWIFMGYGTNYKQALYDFTLFAGRIPLPPRYAFGYWWSRYWHYSDNDFRELVQKMKQYDIPCDVLVMDMDWHYINDNLGDWTGYSWNRRLFPSPEGFMNWLKDNGLKVTMNLHPADGIKTWEDNWAQMAQAVGMDTLVRKDIPWQGSDKQFMSRWYDVMLRPLEQMGIDFWWLDWQQYPFDKRLENLSNTWWINYTTYTDMERHRPTRPMLYHRWGGLGNHRYQIGFSGDATISWKSLDFQPYFNSTASNVLYGYWSHDIGGHTKANHIDPELYIRWMQFGAYSPILRTHSTKNKALNKEPWAFENKYTEILRDIIKLRYHLVPYIYTMARKAYDEALPLCRPMYYDYPTTEAAYQHPNEYMFGDNLLIYPITAPMNDECSLIKVWLPEGNEWYETASGTLIEGGQTIENNFHLDECPVYAKAGCVIPMYGDIKNLNRNDEAYTLTVYPSSNPITTQSTIYEDNGNDQNYQTEYATTIVSATHHDRQHVTVHIAPRQGSYQKMPARRDYQIALVASAVPRRVTVNNQEVNWTYDGLNLSLHIDIPQIDCATNTLIEIEYPDDIPSTTDGLLRRMKRTRENVLALKRNNAFLIVSEDLGVLENTGRLITYHPERFTECINRYNEVYNRLPEVLNAIEGTRNRHISEKEINWFKKATY